MILKSAFERHDQYEEQFKHWFIEGSKIDYNNDSTNSKIKWKIDDNRWRENCTKSDQIKCELRIVFVIRILELIKLLNASNHKTSTINCTKLSMAKWDVKWMARHEISRTVAANNSQQHRCWSIWIYQDQLNHCNAYFNIKIFIRKFKNAFGNGNKCKCLMRDVRKCDERETTEKLLTYVKHVPRLFFVDDILWLVFYTKSCIAIRFSFTFYMRFDCLLSLARQSFHSSFYVVA